MEFITKKCVKCGKQCKFRIGAPNEKVSICGECFNWATMDTNI